MTCSTFSSLAVTSEGNVLFWGRFFSKNLTKVQLKPAKLKITDVKSIICFGNYQYFINNDNKILFIRMDKEAIFNAIPKLISDCKFDKIHSINNLAITATREQILYHIISDRFYKTTFTNFIDFYLDKFGVTPYTLHLQSGKISSEISPEQMKHHLILGKIRAKNLQDMNEQELQRFDSNFYKYFIKCMANEMTPFLNIIGE